MKTIRLTEILNLAGEPLKINIEGGTSENATIPRAIQIFIDHYPAPLDMLAARRGASVYRAVTEAIDTAADKIELETADYEWLRTAIREHGAKLFKFNTPAVYDAIEAEKPAPKQLAQPETRLLEHDKGDKTP